MFSRHLILSKTSRGFYEFCSSRRLSQKFNRQSLYSIFKSHSLKQFPCYRFVSSSNISSKKVRNLVGAIITCGVAVGCVYYMREISEDENVEKDVDLCKKPFRHLNLEEDIKSLNDYGKIPYLLVGAGCASFAAYRAIRIADPTAKVLIIGEEEYYPYKRPPLSKEMWLDPNKNAETLSHTSWNGGERSLFYEQPEYYFTVKEILENPNGGVSVIRGVKVVRVDPAAQVVYLDDGATISYEKCLLATGSKPKNIPLFENADKNVKKLITLFRTANDYKKLHRICDNSDSIVILGGGFLGSELAYGISKKRSSNSFKTFQIFPESGNLGKYLPEYLSKWITKELTAEGIKVIPEVSLKKVFSEENKLVLELDNNEVMKTDHVVVAVGSDANTEIAKASGLEVDEKNGGFVVNTEMEARKNLWIAGDASCFYDILLGRRRVEHYDHAVVSGRLAGENMAGSGLPYSHQSMFWSDMGNDMGFEAVGIIDSTLPTVGIFVKDIETPKAAFETNDNKRKTKLESDEQKDTVPDADKELRAPQQSDNYNKGMIFYLRNDIIVGILLWNVMAKLSIARQILNESKSYEDLTEVAKLFDLNSSKEEE